VLLPVVRRNTASRLSYALGRQEAIEPQDAGSLERSCCSGVESEGRSSRITLLEVFIPVALWASGRGQRSPMLPVGVPTDRRVCPSEGQSVRNQPYWDIFQKLEPLILLGLSSFARGFKALLLHQTLRIIHRLFPGACPLARRKNLERALVDRQGPLAGARL
jgi:hypothetical protein